MYMWWIYNLLYAFYWKYAIQENKNKVAII